MKIAFTLTAVAAASLAFAAAASAQNINPPKLNPSALKNVCPVGKTLVCFGKRATGPEFRFACGDPDMAQIKVIRKQCL